MKKLFAYLPKKLLIALAAITSVATILGLAYGVQAGFGPERPTYTMQKPADHITFDSITNNPVAGDERFFLKGALPGASKYTDPVTGAQDGQEITLEMYVHNNAASNLNLKAKDVTVRVALPQGSKQEQVITGFINSSNSAPKEIFDTLNVTGAQKGFFELQYVPGSATLTNNHFKSGVKLSDSIVTSGAKVGFDSLNGVIPGCAEFSGWVTLRVKVNMPHYTIQKSVRLAGESADQWRANASAKLGDTVEWRVEVRNIGSTTLDNIVVLDQLPPNTEIVPGSVELINTVHPAANPYIYPASAIQHSDGKVWVNVDGGSYLPNSNFFIRFNTKLVDSESLKCGSNHLINTAWATPHGYGSVSGNASVDVNKNCGQPLFSCDNLDVATVGDRSIKAQVEVTAESGAKFQSVNFTFGDNTNLVTSNLTADHTYASDGTFTVRATPSFMVNSKLVTADSESCVKQVTFENGQPVTPVTPTTPENLPNTGPGSLVGLFVGSSILGTLGYRFLAIRRQGR